VSDPGRLRIVKMRRPSGTTTWVGYLVARDEHGTWLFTPRGSERLMLRERQAGLTTYEGDRLHLAPRGEWWFATWSTDGLELDVCLPPELGETDVRFADLKVDLLKDRDGRVSSKDEQQLEEGRREGWISAEEHSNALAVAGLLRSRLEDGAPVFDELGWQRRARAAAQGLPPLPVDQTSNR